MPARFINVSGTGRARFTNVSGTGRANFSGGGGITTSTTTTTTTIVYNTFSVFLLNSIACSGGDERSVRTSNNDISLADASTNSAALYRMPQDELLTGYTYVRDAISNNIYDIGSIDGVVGAFVSFC
jgi:hypothetical protein